MKNICEYERIYAPKIEPWTVIKDIEDEQIASDRLIDFVSKLINMPGLEIKSYHVQSNGVVFLRLSRDFSSTHFKFNKDVKFQIKNIDEIHFLDNSAKKKSRKKVYDLAFIEMTDLGVFYNRLLSKFHSSYKFA